MIKKAIIITAIIGLIACGNSEPPIYKSGMTMEAYGESLGEWYAKKISKSNEAEIENYRELAIEQVENFKKGSIKQSDAVSAAKEADLLIRKIVDLSDKQFNLSLSNWQFLIEPTVDKSASKRSQLEIKYGIRQMLSLVYLGYTPAELSKVIADAYKDKQGGDLYYSVLKNSSFPKIVENTEWLNQYQIKSEITKIAIDAVNNNKFNFVIGPDSKKKISKLDKKIDKLEYEFDFDIIDEYQIVEFMRGMTSLIEFKKKFDLTSKEQFKKEYRDIKYAKRDIKTVKEYLAKNIEYQKRNPDSKWVKESIKNERAKIEKYEAKLNAADKDFEKKYKSDVTLMTENVKMVRELKADLDVLKAKYSHNVNIFVGVNIALVEKGYETSDIEKVLYDGRRVYNLSKYEPQENIKLTSNDEYAYEKFIQKMHTHFNDVKS